VVLHETSVSSSDSHKRLAGGASRWRFANCRPGLNRFLEEMNKMYEMHVYTMGTRSYADAICNAIDPEGKYFGTRILSRDESGSELHPTVVVCAS